MTARTIHAFASLALLLVLAPPAIAAGNAPGVVAPALRCDQPRAPRVASPPASSASPACCAALDERMQAVEVLLGTLVPPASHAIALSAGTLILGNCTPPAPVPGLEIEIEVAEGSSVLVTLDATAHRRCLQPGVGTRFSGHVFRLEIDGTVVASRYAASEDDSDAGRWTSPMAVHGLSEPLAAGPHLVRAVIVPGDIQEDGTPIPCHWATPCYGSVTPGDGLEARLIAVELR